MRDINKGNYLKELRLKNNLTQKDLGDLVHYSDKNISKWEQGKSFPQDDKTLNDLAAALEVDRKDLLCGGKHSIFESKIFKFSILGIVIVTIIVVAVALITKTRVYLIKADNKDIYIENNQTRIYIPKMAVDFLRIVLVFMIKNPIYLNVEEIDGYIDSLVSKP